MGCILVRRRNRRVGRAEPAAQGDVRQRGRGAVRYLEHGPFEPQPAHERVQRLAGEGTKDAMKVAGREVGQPCQLLQRQLLGQVCANVVDDPVDAAPVNQFGSFGLHGGAPADAPSGRDTTLNANKPLRTVMLLHR